MLADIIRATVQRVIKDKILLGLVVVAVLGMFVGGMTINDDKPEAAKKQSQSEQAVSVKDPASTITPELAGQFISWWLGSAMDFNGQTAQQSHTQALSWMTPEAARSFESTLWTPQIAQAVATGRLVAAFQPTTIQPQAINPDGSVVVGVSGTMIVQANGQPATQQFLSCFLVRKEKEGLRVAGLDPRTAVVPFSL